MVSPPVVCVPQRLRDLVVLILSQLPVYPFEHYSFMGL